MNRRELRVFKRRLFIVRHGFSIHSLVIEQAAQIIIRHAKVVFCCQTLQHDIIFRSVREAAVGCSFFSQCRIMFCRSGSLRTGQVVISVSNIIIYQRVNVLPLGGFLFHPFFGKGNSLRVVSCLIEIDHQFQQSVMIYFFRQSVIERIYSQAFSV